MAPNDNNQAATASQWGAFYQRGAANSQAYPGTPQSQFTASVVNMGDWFARRGYTPMSQTYIGRPNVDRSAQMWDVNAAKVYYNSAPPELQSLARDYAISQLGHTKVNEATVASYYEKAVDGAARESMVSGGDPISVWDYMARSVQKFVTSGGALSGSGSGSGGSGGGPSSNTQIQLTNESDAAVLVDQALNSYLDRQATDGEREQFWSMLNKRQSANPTVTRNSGGTNNSSVTTGGLNPQQAAKEFALSRDDAAEYMANTQYTDWLMEKVASDPTEGIASGL